MESYLPPSRQLFPALLYLPPSMAVAWRSHGGRLHSTKTRRKSVKRAPALSMCDGTSQSPSHPRSRRNLAASGFACTALGRPAVRQTAPAHTGFTALKGLLLRPSAPCLPRTTRHRFALRGAQRLRIKQINLCVPCAFAANGITQAFLKPNPQCPDKPGTAARFFRTRR